MTMSRKIIYNGHSILLKKQSKYVIIIIEKHIEEIRDAKLRNQ